MSFEVEAFFMFIVLYAAIRNHGQFLFFADFFV